ncbi:MAG: hypothetical protein Q9196_005624 [Gyalolechia fulgens]
MITKALAVNGASKVYIVGRRKEVLEAAAKESPKGNIIPLVDDVASKDSLRSIASQVEKDTGYNNVLIANSGTGGPQTSTTTPQTSLPDYQSALWSLPQEEYERTFAVNVTAVHYTLIALLHLLHNRNEKTDVQQKSQFIVTSSIAGFTRNVPGGYAYGQSKGRRDSPRQTNGYTNDSLGIRAHGIAPGLYPSEMSAPIIGAGVTTEY